MHIEHACQVVLTLTTCCSCVPSPQRKYSVAKIETSDTYERGLPKVGGLSDLRMGTMDKGGAVCTTDGNTMIDCPGYFGHIDLAKPMYHPGFIKTVVRVLRCVSYHTSKLLLDKVRARTRAVGPLCLRQLA